MALPVNLRYCNCTLFFFFNLSSVYHNNYFPVDLLQCYYCVWSQFYRRNVHVGVTHALGNHPVFIMTEGRKNLHEQKTLDTGGTLWFFTNVIHTIDKKFGIFNFCWNVIMENVERFMLQQHYLIQVGNFGSWCAFVLSSFQSTYWKKSS